MPQVRCECSEILHFGDIPCSIEWHLISDVEFNRISEEVEVTSSDKDRAAVKSSDPIKEAKQNVLSDLLLNRMLPVLLCPHCGRLHVFWHGWKNAAEIFVSEYKPSIEDSKSAASA